jgi:outer membrane scaffolding protein for murein synthesis (MipA/OmpV family)
MLRTAFAAALLASATPAFAQTVGDPGLPDPNDQSDTFTIAAGGAYIPDYEGSDDYKFSPFGAIRGRLNGLNFSTRGTYLYVDLIRQPDSGIDFDAGPIVGIRRERVSKIEDDFVRLFGKRKTAIELGGFVGITAHGLTNPYDALSVRLDVVTDVGNAHESTVFTPNIDFGTPLSKHTYVSLGASADFVSNKYADYYYSYVLFTETESQAGLEGPQFAPPPFSYNAKGGMKNWKLTALINQSITGDLTHGLSIFGAGTYSRLVGSIGRSPFVDDRGSKSQWQGVLGLAYTF